MTFLSELSSKAAALSHPPQKNFHFKKCRGGESIQISLPSVSPLIYSNRNPRVKSFFLRFGIRYYFCTFFFFAVTMQYLLQHNPVRSAKSPQSPTQMEVWAHLLICLRYSNCRMLWESSTDLGGREKNILLLLLLLLSHISENSVYMWWQFEQKYRYVAVFLSHKCPDVDSGYIGTSVLLAYLVPQFI